MLCGGKRGLRLKVRRNFTGFAWREHESPDRGAKEFVVLPEGKCHGRLRRSGLPAPFADGDELQRFSLFGGKSRPGAAHKEFITDADVGGYREADFGP